MKQHVRIAAGVSLSLIAMGVATSAACLPDLDPVVVIDAAPGPASLCGDGVIEAFDGGVETCDPGDAATAGCLNCQITCEGLPPDPTTGHCYFVGDPTDSLQTANQQCAVVGAHVVTIASDAERRIVEGLSQAAPFWIGLSLDNIQEAYDPPTPGVSSGLEPGWPEPSLGTGPCTGCYAEGLDGGGFDALGVSSLPEGGSCVGALGSHWGGVPCSIAKYNTQFKTICEREPQGRRAYGCGGGALCFALPPTARKKSYFVSADPASLDVAVATCAALGKDGRLVVLESPEEREALVRELFGLFPLNDVASRSFWVGLAFTNDTWTWGDGAIDGDLDAGRVSMWANAEPATILAGQASLKIASQYDTGLLVATRATDAPRGFVCQTPSP